jgi:hypothetical protein
MTTKEISRIVRELTGQDLSPEFIAHRLEQAGFERSEHEESEEENTISPSLRDAVNIAYTFASKMPGSIAKRAILRLVREAELGSLWSRRSSANIGAKI